MSLFESMLEDFVFIDKIRTPEPEGGYIVQWEEGATIKAVATLDSSIDARIAETQGTKNIYTISTSKDNALDYHDVLKRVRDGKIFRVTSDGEDNNTPNIAYLDMRQVSAERWELTT